MDYLLLQAFSLLFFNFSRAASSLYYTTSPHGRIQAVCTIPSGSLFLLNDAYFITLLRYYHMIDSFISVSTKLKFICLLFYLVWASCISIIIILGSYYQGIPFRFHMPSAQSYQIILSTITFVWIIQWVFSSNF